MTILDSDNLCVGDSVKFELSTQGYKNRPRWENDIDCGGTGEWAFGIIAKITSTTIYVDYTLTDHVGVGTCEWPNKYHNRYQPYQWKREGYLQLNNNKCECGSEKLYGKNGCHSSWCPLYFGR